MDGGPLMAAGQKLISADSHVNEVPESFERVQKKRGDLAPKFIRTDEGTYLVVEGWTDPVHRNDRLAVETLQIRPNSFYEDAAHKYVGMVIGNSQKATSASDLTRESRSIGQLPTDMDEREFKRNFRFEDFPGAGFDPAGRIKDQDADNVAAEVIYPSILMHLYAISATDEPFYHDIAQSYNEWLLDFISYDPRRLIGQPVLSVLNPEGAAADLEAYATRGVKGCAIASSVPLDMLYGDPKFDVLWAAAQGCDIPLAMHQSFGAFKHIQRGAGNRSQSDTNLSLLGLSPVRQVIGSQLEAEISLAEMIYGGVFDRFPSLKIVCGEFDIGWVGHVFQRLQEADPRLGLKLAPGEYLERNVWFTFEDDRAGVLTTPLFGENNFLWASDYPHLATTWPNSEAFLDRQFQGISDEVRHKITWQNVIDLYQLDLP